MRLSRYLTVEHLDDTVYVHHGTAGTFNSFPDTLWRRVVDFCDGGDDGSTIADELETLVRAGMLVGDSVDELALLERRYRASRHGGGLGLTVVTSLGCNFDCPYCFESKRPSLVKPEVRAALIGLVEDAIAADTPEVGVMWMGGEPLLGADQLFELSQAFMDRCAAADVPYRANITTNGWYLTGEMAEKLAAHGVRAAQVTMDGPADIHDAYRPTKSGQSSYERLLDNIEAAADRLRVNVRVNLDQDNFGRVDELLAALAGRGLAGRITLSPARLTTISSADDAPAQTYQAGCYSCAQFGQVEMEFDELAEKYGLRGRPLPGKVSTPCTAVRSTELVVGSDGELWKCWDDIGNPDEAIGTIFDYATSNENMAKWLGYSPFNDDACRSCIALPGCMGGCAHHTFHGSREEQCLTFRFNHRERVRAEARRWAGAAIEPTGLVHYGQSRLTSPLAAPAAAVPVTLGPTRRSVSVGS